MQSQENTQLILPQYLYLLELFLCSKKKKKIKRDLKQAACLGMHAYEYILQPCYKDLIIEIFIKCEENVSAYTK